MLLHQYKEQCYCINTRIMKKKSHTLLDVSHLGNARHKIFPHAFQQFSKLTAPWFGANLTTKRTVILPWGLNPYDLPCLQKSLVHIACGNCLPGSEEPSCHLSTSSPATRSEGIGRQPLRPRRRRCYSGAKRAQDRTHSVAHLFKFSVQGRNINIFRLISKERFKTSISLAVSSRAIGGQTNILFSRKPTTAAQGDSDGSEIHLSSLSSSYLIQLSDIFNISFRYFLYIYRGYYTVARIWSQIRD